MDLNVFIEREITVGNFKTVGDFKIMPLTASSNMNLTM